MSNTREFIVYLEPTSTSGFRKLIDEFLAQQPLRYYPTTATKYNCHVSMTGFFHIPNEPGIVADIVMLLENILQVENGHSTLLNVPPPQISTEPLHTASRLFSHLLLPVLAPEAYRQVARGFADGCQKRDSRIVVRPKATNHISLAYWDEPHATQEQQQQWYLLTMMERLLERMQDDARKQFVDVPNPADWDIVLYERVLVGEKVGEKHVFAEQGRWSVSRGTPDQ
ncbi:hypothetical protein DFQ28_010136 [Apophysomyces sp. BC1034]|nr:hypothetical protein DFQ29_008431 [Apophysomyces sp. BC1021]KAG0184997.1 hypothetical protein DFQ28_010136 [Apophysomyces sp. BC1034]